MAGPSHQDDRDPALGQSSSRGRQQLFRTFNRLPIDTALLVPAIASTIKLAKIPIMKDDLLALSREIKGIAECGLHYGENEFDRERYQRLHQIASEILHSKLPDFRWPVESGYLTPKLDTRGIIIRDGKVLLVREASVGLWTFPGGWADVNLTPSENVIREVLEESGYEVEVTKVLAVWDKQKQGHQLELDYIYKISFACTITGGEAKTSHETDAVEWFDVHELPEMCPHRGAPHYVDLALRHLENPALPTEFD